MNRGRVGYPPRLAGKLRELDSIFPNIEKCDSAWRVHYTQLVAAEQIRKVVCNLLVLLLRFIPACAFRPAIRRHVYISLGGLIASILFFLKIKLGFSLFKHLSKEIGTIAGWRLTFLVLIFNLKKRFAPALRVRLYWPHPTEYKLLCIKMVYFRWIILLRNLANEVHYFFIFWCIINLFVFQTIHYIWNSWKEEKLELIASYVYILFLVKTTM
jgi:Ca2+/Na+ antiporter